MKSGPKPNPRSKVEATCETCGRRFWRWASQVKHRGPARFCSRVCKDKAQNRSVTVPCRWCGQPVERQPWMAGVRGKFCNRSCYTAWDKARRTVDLTCAHCGVNFTRSRTSHAQTGGADSFCSRDCTTAHQVKENHHAYRGPKLGRRTKSWWEPLAESIRERDGRSCVRCSAPEADEPAARRLQVDHIIPERLFTNPADAHTEVNLAALCTGCHARKTHYVEPRLMRGDWLALAGFYGDLAGPAMDYFNTVP